MCDFDFYDFSHILKFNHYPTYQEVKEVKSKQAEFRIKIVTNNKIFQ